MTILAVEDDALQLEVMCEFLQETGYKVLSAGSPDAALSLARAYDEPN